MFPKEAYEKRERHIKKRTAELVAAIKQLEEKLMKLIDREIISQIVFDDNGVKRTKGNLAKISRIKAIERRAKKDKEILINKAVKAMREEVALSAEYYRTLTGKKRLAANQVAKEAFDARLGINKNGQITRGKLFNLKNSNREFIGVTQAITNGIMSQAPANEFRQSVTSTFTESNQSFGNTLSSELRTEQATNARQLDKVYADELDLKFYQFTGGLVDRSRDFCEEKIGEVFHESEILAWQNQTWKGKSSPYDPFTDVGGYNCMHTLRPVSRELANQMGKDVENYD
jgi:hypothetical protein